MKRLLKHSGSAIVVALFITALIAAMSVAMMIRFHVDVKRTHLMLNATQAYFYQEGALFWAKDQLKNNWQSHQPNQLTDKIPIHIENKINDAIITSDIQDAQGLFNVNNLSDENYQQSFVRLIQLVSPQINLETASTIAIATIDWISPTKKNSLDIEYQQLNPPYVAPHHPMAHISELRLVKGMNAELFQKLSPYLTALPEVTPININNAPLIVLMSLNNNMTEDAAKTIQQLREKNPFATTQQFLQLEVLKNFPVSEKKITTVSQYFFIESKIKFPEKKSLLFTALLQRRPQEKKSEVSVLWQSQGIQ